MKRKSPWLAPQTRSRKIVLRVSAVLLGLAPFVLIEMTLRLLDYPPSAVTDAVDRDPLVDLHQLRPLFEPTADGSAMRIPRRRENFFQPAQFSTEKPADGLRIFVVGGSTVQGRPYATETAFPKLLEVQLRTAWPDRHWEVINCGGVSYASYRVAAIVDEVLRYQPDLVIVYTGHNEFLEARTYAVHRSVPRAIAPLVAAGCRLHLVQALAALSRGDGSQPPTSMQAEVDALLDHAGGLETYHRDDSHRRNVVEHFQLSLGRIAASCQAADVPLMLCVPASDVLTVPPFKTELKSSANESMRSWWRLVQDPEATAAERIHACEQLLHHDPQHAGAAYILGRHLWHSGDYDAAATWLLVARDQDVCPLRATSEIEALVRRAGQHYALAVVDVPRLFADARQTRICDPKYFVDHVHPSVGAGHVRIADALLQQIAGSTDATGTLGLGPTRADPAQRAAAVAAYLATIDESYYHRGNQRREGLRRWAAGRAAEPLEL